jgi:hypothetical protein
MMKLWVGMRARFLDATFDTTVILLVWLALLIAVNREKPRPPNTGDTLNSRVLTTIRTDPMLKSTAVTLAFLALQPSAALAQSLPPPPVLTESPWNGNWVLSPTRNTAEIQAAAAEGYRFHIEANGRIRWEIPSLHEVVEGRTNGQPMAIHRLRPTSLTLSVIAESPRVLRYTVSRDGKPEGEGRMTLVERDKTWVDITGVFGRPDLTSVVLYVRPGAAKK